MQSVGDSIDCNLGTKSNPNLIFLENEADVPSYHRQCELCDKEEEAIDKS